MNNGNKRYLVLSVLALTLLLLSFFLLRKQTKEARAKTEWG